MSKDGNTQSTIEKLKIDEKQAYNSYSKALYWALFIPVIVSFVIFLIFSLFIFLDIEPLEDTFIKTIFIVLGIIAVIISIVAPDGFVSERRRDYEMKRNHLLAEQRKINRELFIDAFAEELYNLQQRTEKKESSTTCEYRDLPDHEKELYRHLAENAIIKAGY